jgi:hypothetical protein
MEKIPVKIPHLKWAKTQRAENLSYIITEKLDGTNAVLYIDKGTKELYCGSRNHWLGHHQDNHGFWNWCNVPERKQLILECLPHNQYIYGEFIGKGIQRGYGMDHKELRLFIDFRQRYEFMYNPNLSLFDIKPVPILARIAGRLLTQKDIDAVSTNKTSQVGDFRMLREGLIISSNLPGSGNIKIIESKQVSIP